MGARETKCPTCKGRVPADPEARTRDFPFCCERCRLIDLGRWLSGEY
ncbi:MAG: DNA gyrase inhibitor YacG, partial [Planctomycetota bacterium]